MRWFTVKTLPHYQKWLRLVLKIGHSGDNDRTGLLRDQRPILNKNWQTPPHPPQPYSLMIHSSADFWAWAVDFMLFKVVKSLCILQRAQLISSFSRWTRASGCRGSASMSRRARRHGWAYRLWRCWSHWVVQLRLKMASYEGKLWRLNCISYILANPENTVD